MNKKSLKDVSWDVPEETYRADHALSYSTISRYEREGFNKLDNIFDRIDTPSLTFGSAVDAIITGGEEEFNSRFINLSFPQVSSAIIEIVKALFIEFNVTHRTLESIPDVEIIGFASRFNYQNNWKPETRVKVIKEKGSEYYKQLFAAGDKTILDDETYKYVRLAVKSLRENDATSWYVADNNPFEDVERFYQLKFKATLHGVPYRCMFDELIVFHKDKLIMPIDFKTSCKIQHREWNFPEHYIEWNYQIQNRLYVRILAEVIKNDDYFKDFTILPYKDIIIFKGSNTPLVWNIPFTFDTGTIYMGKNKQIEMKDPEELGKELYDYLTKRPIAPNGIKLNEGNNIVDWINKL